MIKTPYPYHRPKPQHDHLKPVRLEDEGTEGKIPRFAWMSDGPTRAIERGLPISTSPPPALDPSKKSGIESLISLLVDRPYLKAFHRTYGALEAQHPDFDMNDPDMMSHYEKQLIAQYGSDSSQFGRGTELKLRVPGTQAKTTKIPVDAHLHTWGGVIPYLESDIFPEDDFIPPPEPPKPKLRTGIHGETNARAVDQSSIIRPVHFATIKESEAANRALSRDSAIQPVIFAPGSKRAATAIATVPGRGPDHTVKKCVKRFFDPAVGMPFVPSDIGKYFPIELLTPDETVVSASDSDDPLVPPVEEPDTEMKSALLDTSDEDVLFTKNKAPFTRTDISTVRAFGQHWDNIKLRQRDRAAQALRERQHMIRQAFHSKAVFETYLQMVEKDCKRIRCGLIGKSEFKTKSVWDHAVESAPPDEANMPRRREFWWRFCAFVRFLGGLHEPHEKAFVKLVRAKLMLRHEVNSSLFWHLVEDSDPAGMESVATLRLVEFCRILLDVGQHEFSSYLEGRQEARMIYGQTIMSNLSKEYLDKEHQVAKGPMDVPECDWS
jgi:hypothetical protein